VRQEPSLTGERKSLTGRKKGEGGKKVAEEATGGLKREKRKGQKLDEQSRARKEQHEHRGFWNMGPHQWGLRAEFALTEKRKVWTMRLSRHTTERSKEEEKDMRDFLVRWKSILAVEDWMKEEFQSIAFGKGKKSRITQF